MHCDRETSSVRERIATKCLGGHERELKGHDMNSDKRLKGRRIAALAADGFEKVELTVPRHALRLAGAKVDVSSLRHGRIRGVNLHEPASRVMVTKTVREADPAAYDGLPLPGGFINPDLLRQSAEVRQFVRASAPQRDEPPALVLEAMKWMPRPSFRTAFICGALALGLAAGNRRHLPA